MIRLFTDAGLLSANPSSIGGVYAFVVVDDDDNITMEKTGIIDACLGYEGVVTSNLAELYCLCYGIMQIPAGSHAGIYSDSEVSIGRVFQAQRRAGVPMWLSQLTDNARLRLANLKKFEYSLVGGHPNRKELELGKTIARKGRMGGLMVSHWNVYCDNLCKVEAEKWHESRKEEAA